VTIYNRKPSFVYGFHGLDKNIAQKILLQEEDFRLSQNDYDWLGAGVYFWENNIERARQYAITTSKRKNSSVKKPYVLGAIIDLGNCLDLLDQQHLDFLQEAYYALVEDLKNEHTAIPQNFSFGENDFDFKNRKLDCAVINYAHMLAKRQGVFFDTVRSVFWEGQPLYPEAGFQRHNHIQIAVINPSCIKGIFLPKLS
jgi:hypothetical protein